MNSILLVIGAAGLAGACYGLARNGEIEQALLFRFAAMGLYGCVATAFRQSFLLGVISVSVSLGFVAVLIPLFQAPKPLITLRLGKDDQRAATRRM